MAVVSSRIHKALRYLFLRVSRSARSFTNFLFILARRLSPVHSMEPVESDPNANQETSPVSQADTADLPAQTSPEHEVETLETTVVEGNGSNEANHSTSGAGAVGATSAPTGPRAGSFSWTVRCPDAQKSGLVESDATNFTTGIDNQKNRFLNELPEFGADEYTARVIGLSRGIRDELEGRLAIIFTEVVVRVDTISEADMLETVKSKLLEFGWPVETLTAGKRKIEETLGQNAALEQLVVDISDKMDGKLDKLLLDPVGMLSKEPPLDGATIADFTASLRDDLHQLALSSILEAMELVHLKRRLEGADVDLLMYKLSQLERSVRILENSHDGLVNSSITLAGSLSKTRKTALSHSFHLMEPVLRLDVVYDKNVWKSYDTKTRKNTVIKVLDNIVGNNAGSESDVWCMKDSKKAPGGVKITFIDTETKFLAEKKLSAYRSDQQKSKKATIVFTSSRMAPIEFSEDRKEMEQVARNKIAEDWIDLVEKFVANGGDKDHWITDPDTVRKCLRLRVKWKLRPTLTVWTEAQDPLHRYVWKPFNMVENFFKGYDLAVEVPCPHTKECLSTNPSWKTPRTVPPHFELRRIPPRSRGGSKSNATADQAQAQVGTDASIQIMVENGDNPPEATELSSSSSLNGTDPEAGGAGSLHTVEADVPITGGPEDSQDGKLGVKRRTSKTIPLPQVSRQTRALSAGKTGKSK